MANYFITGARRGIGLEFVRQLTARGDKVYAGVRDPNDPGELAGLKVALIKVDVGNIDDLNNLGGAMAGQPVDVLINNAGVSSGGKSLDTLDAAEMQQVFMVNSTGPMLVAKALLPNLRAGSQRKVFNVTSLLASIAGNTGGFSYAYRASKAALNMLTSCMSVELGPDGFTCIAQSPGWVKTDMGGKEAPLSPQESISMMLRVIERVQPSQSGSFLDLEGKPIPW